MCAKTFGTDPHKTHLIVLKITFYISGFTLSFPRVFSVSFFLFFPLTDSPELHCSAADCLLSTGIKHNCQLGVEVGDPNDLV